ncbi:hypothetical protein ILFOPFJJ_01727 [Ensifer psoraleae]|uniref:DUF6130 family protein n=1 Tax=Sinorhizobium TaxID=28105 RepID=UPI001569FD61|nr:MULTISPECIES: DUF6130 family protein [Sinorhizobium]MDK1388560.1 DUF6130 family protein [Sinorhizobium sp. 7-81]NRP70845.1 hypothetical protein [Sinorhizobium psoraleae]
MFIRTLAAAAAAAVLATSAFAEGSGEGRPAPVFFPIKNEPPPKLIVEPPLAGALARGAVLIPYRTENFRIVSVFGAGASTVSPRVGHLHVTVDDSPWRWAETGDTSTVVVVGLPPGEHKVRLELASPEHQVFTGETVAFTVPETAAHPH